ncbi:polyisoprenoid-binding protein YceI [Thermonema lapsum]|uniref:Polyisoprenoid-binding protein YceI n=1 Tax=Thermonema lapsum TaxID=28195 RepID=A0A846MTU7_9BACT|nr:YceI family protein [Thermonema lapsum]NIK74752.1 polyisoprenoid-binding protein YceI [Thermonema lapsum]
MKTWKVDPTHAVVEFAVPHMVIGEVVGVFQRFEASLKVPSLEFEQAQLSARIETASIFTNHEPRDKHLCSADFFDTEHFPYMTFESRRFVSKGNRTYDIEGMLEIKGRALPFTLHAQYKGLQMDPWGNDRLGFAAEGKLNRILWGLTWNNLLQNGAYLIGHEVRLRIACELITEEAYKKLFAQG